MNNFSQEMVDGIAEHIPPWFGDTCANRPGLATLSRSWQSAIERQTFRSIKIQARDLEDFCTIFARCKRRRGLLRQLYLNITFPQYDDDHFFNFENAEDRAEGDSVFSRHVSILLQELSQWPIWGRLSLHIELDSFQDFRFRHRYLYSQIRLGGALAFAIPHITIPHITSFCTSNVIRCVAPGSQVALTSTFPNLKRIDWCFNDPLRFPALRRQLFQELTSAVDSFQPQPASKTLCININRQQSYPHNERLPSFKSNGNSLCGSICALLARSKIENFDYVGPIDPTLFWPSKTSKTSEPRPWSSLQRLDVDFQSGSLQGQWFFKGLPDDPDYDENTEVPLPQDETGLLAPGYNDNDEMDEEARMVADFEPVDSTVNNAQGHNFRCVLRDEAILPLLKAVARRIAHTRFLQKVNIRSELLAGGMPWFFSYHAPGQGSVWDDQVDREGSGCNNPLSRARVFIVTSDDWRPDGEVMALLRWIGMAHDGKDTIITFLPFLPSKADSLASCATTL
ncbi:hypothetical protein DHEL01_v201656 [Diaporthe helianthi]|uniref:F-box domain-containing protein n=1 Tax=Diaporthe helianthi TaxID=158607 RepID=A0A2P5IBS8_DIAHE|nr:hypothetical protein DHEL01_v201656 [Diaporthe helianthi]